MIQEQLTGGPGSPGLPGSPSLPCQTQTKRILKHICKNGNVYEAQSEKNELALLHLDTLYIRVTFQIWLSQTAFKIYGDITLNG